MFIFFNKANKLRGASHSEKFKNKKMKLFPFYFLGPAFLLETTENETAKNKVKVKIVPVAVAIIRA